MGDKYDVLKLENQLCFPLYAVSKEIVRKYKEYLDELDMTYTQYISMMVLWEHGELSVKELGEYIYLDSGTLTPLLKTLEKKGWVKRTKSLKDERVLNISLTEKGKALRDKALSVPGRISACVKLEEKEAKQLYDTLYKLLGELK